MVTTARIRQKNQSAFRPTHDLRFIADVNAWQSVGKPASRCKIANPAQVGAPVRSIGVEPTNGIGRFVCSGRRVACRILTSQPTRLPLQSPRFNDLTLQRFNVGGSHYLNNGTPSLQNSLVISVYVLRHTLPPGIFNSSRIGLSSVKIIASLRSSFCGS